MACKRAKDASRVLVNQRHLLIEPPGAGTSDRLLDSIPACLIERAENLADSARDAQSEELDLDIIVRQLEVCAGQAESKGDPQSGRLSGAADILKGVLDAARRVLKARRESSASEYAGTMVMDDENWAEEEFDELADAIGSGSMRLADIGASLRGNAAGSCIDPVLGDTISGIASMLRRFRNTPPGWAASMEGVPHRNPRRITIKLLPVDVRPYIKRLLDEVPGGILAVGRHLRRHGSFEGVRLQWGLEGRQVEERVLEDESLVPPPLFLPEDMLPPTSRSAKSYDWQKYIERTANVIRMIAESLGGRTVAIFSSNHDLRKVHELLSRTPPRDCITLGQYQDGTKSALVREYLANQSTLLLGGRNFPEAVDFGPAGFTVLVLVKIPFPSPEDPLHKAAVRMEETSGRDGLQTHLVPVAIDTVNRWIDSLTAGAVAGPSGAVVLLDPRALHSEWGEEFLTAINAQPVNRMSFREMLSNLKQMKRDE
jgi:Rad3-related DNA helicase